MGSEDYMVVMYHFSDFGGCISVIKEIFPVCKKNMLEYSRVMGL